ncbi:sigma-70 family RNA polymerase sigma factor [Nocardia sp. NBC_00565]|uniref:sigma-70 family RNA polymerase sigma factor n=1 Tax=Nocardia sp. NBC_00565 TaxID=2975993 RepID=UPI002E81D336|nr:sigma-70 family RNA polymerase sigma factor [Nocardia sp. NBC_00565]
MWSSRTCSRSLELELGEITQALIAADAYRTNSLDIGVGHDDEGTRPSVIDTLGAVEPCYRLLEDAMSVRPLIAALPERERRVLIMRFFEAKTQTQIAERLGVSQMQVSRILARTLDTLREQAIGADPGRKVA